MPPMQQKEGVKSSPAFQFYPADFLVGTADMTADEVGGYIRLLCYQWTKGSLPNEDKKLMQLSGVFTPNELSNIKSKFKRQDDGTLVNPKMEKVRTDQDEYREKQRIKAQKRWESHSDAAALPEVMPESCPSPSTSSLPIPSTTPTPSVIDVDKKQKRFSPPTINEVYEYCKERGNAVDPQRFIDHYTSNGWMVGKNKMKDWRASVRTWEKNSTSNNQTNGTGTAKPGFGKPTMDDRMASAIARNTGINTEPPSSSGDKNFEDISYTDA